MVNRGASSSCGCRGLDFRRSFWRRFWNQICTSQPRGPRSEDFGSVESWHRVPGPLSRPARRGQRYSSETPCPAWGFSGTRPLELHGPLGYNREETSMVSSTRAGGSTDPRQQYKTHLVRRRFWRASSLLSTRGGRFWVRVFWECTRKA